MNRKRVSQYTARNVPPTASIGLSSLAWDLSHSHSHDYGIVDLTGRLVVGTLDNVEGSPVILLWVLP